jgi:hypothetical protein
MIMAEIDFFLDKHEEQIFLTQVFEEGFTLIPEISDYEGPIPKEINNLLGYYQFTKIARLFFLKHPAYSVYPVVMKKYDARLNKNGHYIMPRYGGPFIDYLSSREIIANHSIMSGFLAYYPTYWNPTSNAFTPIPNEVKRRYYKLCNIIKNMSEVYSNKRKYYIGRVALNYAKQGGELVGIEKEMLRQFLSDTNIVD